MSRNLKIFTTIFLALVFMGAVTSQVNTYINGTTLTANQLNAEFGNIYSTLNNLDDANFSATPALDPTKISSSIAGDGVGRDSGTGVLSVGVDGSTLEINSDALRIKDSGVVTAKIADDSVTSAKIPNSAVGTTELAGDSVTTSKILDGTIALADLASDSVNSAKIVANSVAKSDLAVKTASSSTATLGNVAVAASSGVVSSAGDISSVTLTTGGGPVIVGLQAVNHATNQGYIGLLEGVCEFKLFRGATQIFYTQVGTQSGDTTNFIVPPNVVTALDVPSAGTYTYKATLVRPSGCTVAVTNVRLVAYEL